MPGGKTVQQLIGNVPLVIKHERRVNTQPMPRPSMINDTMSDTSMAAGDVSIQTVFDVRRNKWKSSFVAYYFYPTNDIIFTLCVCARLNDYRNDNIMNKKYKYSHRTLFIWRWRKPFAGVLQAIHEYNTSFNIKSTNLLSY